MYKDRMTIPEIAKKLAQPPAPSIKIEYDLDLEKRVYQKAPTYGYLRQIGVGTKTRKSAVMSHFVYPIEIRYMALEETELINLMADEIQKGMICINQKKDVIILQGDQKKDEYSFNGFTNLFTSHKKTLNDSISFEAVCILYKDIIKDKGNPSVIVTTATVARKLKELVPNKFRYVDSVETDYITIENKEIPIIVDCNIDTGKNNDDHKLFIIDERTLIIEEFMVPTLIDLYKTKLTTIKLITNYMTFLCCEEWKNGFLEKINP